MNAIDFFILLLAAVTIQEASIPSHFLFVKSEVFIWFVDGNIYKVNLKTNSFEKLSFPKKPGKFLFIKGSKWYFLKGKRIFISDPPKEIKINLPDDMPRNYPYKFDGEKAYFLSKDSSYLFEVFVPESLKFCKFIKRDAEDSLIASFSVTDSFIYTFNPVHGSLKKYSKITGEKLKSFKVPKFSKGLWGIKKHKGYRAYFGGVAEIVKCKNQLILSCFSYKDYKTSEPLTFVYLFQRDNFNLFKLERFQIPSYAIGCYKNRVVFLSYNKKQKVLKLWTKKF